MGYGNKQVLALFKDPRYLGPNMAFEKRGEPFIRELITEVFARWGKVASWGVTSTEASMHPAREGVGAPEPQSLSTEVEESVETDPMGAPVPKLNV